MASSVAAAARGQPPSPANIFQATYSGVPVYEMQCNRIAVMRRKEDSYMNATQILKVLDFDKPKRTRILEKEVQTGLHEKVQGGYGKYQGTWISLERSKELARQYGAYDLLRTLFEYRPERHASPPPAPKHAWAPPGTREQKVKRPRGRPRKTKAWSARTGPDGAGADRSMVSLSTGAASGAATALNGQASERQAVMARKRQRLSRRTATAALEAIADLADEDEDYVDDVNDDDDDEEEEVVDEMDSDIEDDEHHVKVEAGDRFYLAGNALDITSDELLEAYRTKNGLLRMNYPSLYKRLGSSGLDLGHLADSDAGHRDHDDRVQYMDEDDDDEEDDDDDDEEDLGSTMNLALSQLPLHQQMAESVVSAESSDHDAEDSSVREARRRLALESHMPRSAQDHAYAQQLLDYFATDSQLLPQLLLQPPGDLDVDLIIDDEGHTAMHWAAATARLKLIKLLLQRGASTRSLSKCGHTPLVRAVLFSNNFNRKTFPDLLDILLSTVKIRDDSGRTVMHHVALSAGSRGRIHAARYYMDCLLERLSNTLADPGVVVDMQEQETGDTALHIAARVGNRIMVKRLLDAGANHRLENYTGEQARSLIYDMEQQLLRPSTVEPGVATNPRRVSTSGQTSEPVAGQPTDADPGHSPPPPTTASTRSAYMRQVMDRLTASGQQLRKPIEHAQGRVRNFLMPRVAEMMDKVREECTQELYERTMELRSIVDMLDSIYQRVEDARRTTEDLAWQETALAEQASKVRQLEQQLYERYQSSEEMAWRKLLTPEHPRSLCSTKASSSTTTSSAAAPVNGAHQKSENGIKAQPIAATTTPIDHRVQAAALTEQITALRQSRDQHLKRLVQLRGHSGGVERIDAYRYLLAKCTGVSVVDIDGALDAILESFETEQTSDQPVPTAITATTTAPTTFTATATSLITSSSQ